MSWTLLLGVALSLGLALLASIARRQELHRMERRLREREHAARAGNQAQLQHPVVDLSRCLGCGACVTACPEDGVLEMVHGQAVVVNGARCVGHAACERECPVGAITVTIANLAERRDVPALTPALEAIGSPGLFLAGEVTAHALIKTAIEHGTAVAAEVARRTVRPRDQDARGGGARNGASNGHVSNGAPSNGANGSHANGNGVHANGADELLDLCVVGAGPAGLACSLEAKRQGLRFVTLDQEPEPGGTVARYPRRKLVVMQPVELPLHGKLERKEYEKEELVEIWRNVAGAADLPLRGGEVFETVERDPSGGYVVRTRTGSYRARHVCLALGRRGTPRKLGVPGEELSKVAYALLDARSYQGRRILVVGGGDSAIETALGLAEQPGNEVTLSYRREAFFRIRSRNERRLAETLADGRLRVIHQSEVVAIRPGEVELVLEQGGRSERERLPNDEVFVMAGGTAPLELLERSGVSFDPALREPVAPVLERGTGLVRALALGFGLSLAALAWALWYSDYYLVAEDARAADPLHAFLRPGRGAGLFFGIAASALIAANLLYLWRRSSRLGARLGSLQAWMTSHVATGVLALLAGTLHSAMAPRDSVGGHALWVMAALVATGAIGRYFYAWVPRAANGRELELDEVKLRLQHLSDAWDASQRDFVDRVRVRVAELIRARQWRSSFAGRVLALFGGQRDLRHALAQLAHEGRAAGVPEEKLRETLQLARRAHRTAVAAAHYEDLRSLLNGWRYLHRWAAALLVLLVVLHVVYVASYGALAFGGAGGGDG